MSEAFGAWQLGPLIAVGGLGEVWRASRSGSEAGPLGSVTRGRGDQVGAVKRLHTHLARIDEGLRQFSVEQQLTTTLPHHRNLVHAFEAGEVDGRPYIALELVDGEDLRRLVAPPAAKDSSAPVQVVIPRSRAIGIAVAACDAASHLHANGWVHGDICPGNLVIETAPSGDRPVLVDLGVARMIGEAGAVRGTHAYMAPEQVKGLAWTEATDVFALGVVLWELLAGARLFHRGPPWLSMAAVVEADAPALADRALDVIVQAALMKDPTHRIQTAAELAERLRAL